MELSFISKINLRNQCFWFVLLQNCITMHGHLKVKTQYCYFSQFWANSLLDFRWCNPHQRLIHFDVSEYISVRTLMCPSKRIKLTQWIFSVSSLSLILVSLRFSVCFISGYFVLYSLLPAIVIILSTYFDLSLYHTTGNQRSLCYIKD